MPRKSISWVLSNDKMTRITVAPGWRDSRDVYSKVRDSKYLGLYTQGTHLYCPPPLTSVHLTVDSTSPLMVHIMLLGGNNQVTHELGVSIECPDTLKDVPVVKL